MKITYYTSIDPRRFLNNTQFKSLADTAFVLGQPGEMFELVADQEQSYATDIIQVRRSLKLTGKFKAAFELHGKINVTLENAQIVNGAPNQTGTIILGDDFTGTLSIINSQVKYTNESQTNLAIWGMADQYSGNLIIKDSTIDGIIDLAANVSIQGNVTINSFDNEMQSTIINSPEWQLSNVDLRMKHGELINGSVQTVKIKRISCIVGPVILAGNWDIDELCLDQNETSEGFQFIGNENRATQISLKSITRGHTPSGSSVFYANNAELIFNNAKLGQPDDHLQASVTDCKIKMTKTNDNMTWVVEGSNVLNVDKESLTSLHQRESEFVDELPQVQKANNSDESNNDSDSDESDDMFSDLATLENKDSSAPSTPEANLSRSHDTKVEQSDDKKAGKDAKKAPEPDGLTKLNSMIGLVAVKKKVRDYTEVAKFNVEARKRGLQETTGMNRHMIFGGNPGTGKTTVAKYIAQILYENDALPSNKFTSVGVRDLVGDHKGETAKSTHKIIDDALGGVLLIDEAYRLDDHGDSFGDEAIGELTQVIDDKKYRDNLIIILAGYSKPMKDLLNNVNPGFRSRFNNWIEFPDYSTSEKIQIFQKDCKDNGVLINPSLLNTKMFKWLLKFYSRDHANGRSVRNLFDSLGQARINRVTPQMSKLDNKALMTVTADDIKTVYQQAAKTLKREKAEKAKELAKKKGLQDNV